MPTNNTSDWSYGEEMHGVIQRVVRDRGFAFVRSGGQDYFMHSSDYDGNFAELAEQQAVRFIPTNTPKGLRATQVERLR